MNATDYKTQTGNEVLDSDNQRILGKLVDREIYYNVSVLVYELAQKFDAFPDYEDDLLGAFIGTPDYEEAAFDAAWTPFTDEYGVQCWENQIDGTTWAGSAENLCEEFDIDVDDYHQEIFEHWIISDHFATVLEEHGEKVLRDFFGMTVWCRSTTGQAILLDGVIAEIAMEMEILKGMKHEWSV